jgi:hypothetical protein
VSTRALVGQLKPKTVVVSWDRGIIASSGGGFVSVYINGASVATPNVRYPKGYTPVNGDEVELISRGSDRAVFVVLA